MTTPLGRYYYPYFTDEEIETESYYTVKIRIKPIKSTPASSPVPYCCREREIIPVKHDKPDTHYESHSLKKDSKLDFGV